MKLTTLLLLGAGAYVIYTSVHAARAAVAGIGTASTLGQGVVTGGSAGINAATFTCPTSGVIDPSTPECLFP